MIYSDKSSTEYVSFKKINYLYVDMGKLKKDRNNLIKELREKNIVVSTTYNDNLIKKIEDQYYKDVKEYKILQEKIIKVWDDIYKKGLYAPTSDNLQLKEAYKLSWELDAYNYRNKPISIIRSIKRNIEEIKNQMKIKNYRKVAI